MPHQRESATTGQREPAVLLVDDSVTIRYAIQDRKSVV